jgi:hypothetical protein
LLDIVKAVPGLLEATKKIFQVMNAIELKLFPQEIVTESEMENCIHPLYNVLINTKKKLDLCDFFHLEVNLLKYVEALEVPKTIKDNYEWWAQLEQAITAVQELAILLRNMCIGVVSEVLTKEGIQNQVHITTDLANLMAKYTLEQVDSNLMAEYTLKRSDKKFSQDLKLEIEKVVSSHLSQGPNVSNAQVLLKKSQVATELIGQIISALNGQNHEIERSKIICEIREDLLSHRETLSKKITEALEVLYKVYQSSKKRKNREIRINCVVVMKR